jgi:hypothetical protein
VIHSIILGFGYKARSGKDASVAAIIEARRDQYDVRRYAFADALKREVNEAAQQAGGMKQLFSNLPFSNRITYDPNPDMSDPLCPLGKQRELLQVWGSEYRRAQDPDYWVKRTTEQIAKDRPELALLSDMRFKNEVQWVEEYGETIKVVRPGIASVNEHISEKVLDNVPDSRWGAVIVNDGSLEDLKRKAVNTFDALLSRVPADRQALKAA